MATMGKPRYGHLGTRVLPQLREEKMSGTTINTTRSYTPLIPWLRNIMLSTHNIEIWYGKNPDQGGVVWAEAESLTVFRAISGLNDYGADLDDEALVWGTGNSFPIPGNECFGIIRVLVKESSEDTPCYLRFVWGTGTMAEAITAKQYSIAAIQNITAGSKAGGSPFQIMLPMLTLNTHKLWMQVKSTLDDHYVDFLVGVHAYPYCPV